MLHIALTATALCSPEEHLADELALSIDPLDRSAIPASLRRRTSQATGMAFTAAKRACDRAGLSPAKLPAIFASVGGEIQVTDRLCIELAKPDGYLSPTQFHNSVHNTAAGYWSIVTACQEAMTATAAGCQTVAMAMLEAWSMLATGSGELLLVCYDEAWPEYLEPGMGYPPLAIALVLSTAHHDTSLPRIGRPHTFAEEPPMDRQLLRLMKAMPIFAALPLLRALGDCRRQTVPLSFTAPFWAVEVDPGGTCEE